MKNDIKDFIKGTGIILLGLFTVFKHITQKRATLLYPEHKKEHNENFRGQLHCDVEKCVGCAICKNVCPSFNVITIENQKVKTLDISKCIFCGNCVRECPKKVLTMTKKYELATEDKKALLLDTKEEKDTLSE